MGMPWLAPLQLHSLLEHGHAMVGTSSGTQAELLTASIQLERHITESLKVSTSLLEHGHAMVGTSSATQAELLTASIQLERHISESLKVTASDLMKALMGKGTSDAEKRVKAFQAPPAVQTLVRRAENAMDKLGNQVQALLVLHVSGNWLSLPPPDLFKSNSSRLDSFLKGAGAARWLVSDAAFRLFQHTSLWPLHPSPTFCSWWTWAVVLKEDRKARRNVAQGPRGLAGRKVEDHFYIQGPNNRKMMADEVLSTAFEFFVYNSPWRATHELLFYLDFLLFRREREAQPVSALNPIQATAVASSHPKPTSTEGRLLARFHDLPLEALVTVVEVAAANLMLGLGEQVYLPANLLDVLEFMPIVSTGRSTHVKLNNWIQWMANEERSRDVHKQLLDLNRLVTELSEILASEDAPLGNPMDQQLATYIAGAHASRAFVYVVFFGSWQFTQQLLDLNRLMTELSEILASENPLATFTSALGPEPSHYQETLASENPMDQQLSTNIAEILASNDAPLGNPMDQQLATYVAGAHASIAFVYVVHFGSWQLTQQLLDLNPHITELSEILAIEDPKDQQLATYVAGAYFDPPSLASRQLRAAQLAYRLAQISSCCLLTLEVGEATAAAATQGDKKLRSKRMERVGHLHSAFKLSLIRLCRPLQALKDAHKQGEEAQALKDAHRLGEEAAKEEKGEEEGGDKSTGMKAVPKEEEGGGKSTGTKAVPQPQHLKMCFKALEALKNMEAAKDVWELSKAVLGLVKSQEDKLVFCVSSKDRKEFDGFRKDQLKEDKLVFCVSSKDRTEFGGFKKYQLKMMKVTRLAVLKLQLPPDGKAPSQAVEHTPAAPNKARNQYVNPEDESRTRNRAARVVQDAWRAWLALRNLVSELRFRKETERCFKEVTKQGREQQEMGMGGGMLQAMTTHRQKFDWFEEGLQNVTQTSNASICPICPPLAKPKPAEAAVGSKRSGQGQGQAPASNRSDQIRPDQISSGQGQGQAPASNTLLPNQNNPQSQGPFPQGQENFQQGLMQQGQQGLPYPGQQGQQGMPHSGQQGMPYPGQQGMPHFGQPGQQGVPYPGQQGQQGVPYPGQQGLPHSGQQGVPYPGQQGLPHSGQQGLPYPGQQGQQGLPYPGQQDQQGGPYPGQGYTEQGDNQAGQQGHGFAQQDLGYTQQGQQGYAPPGQLGVLHQGQHVPQAIHQLGHAFPPQLHGFPPQAIHQPGLAFPQQGPQAIHQQGPQLMQQQGHGFSQQGQDQGHYSQYGQIPPQTQPFMPQAPPVPWKSHVPFAQVVRQPYIPAVQSQQDNMQRIMRMFVHHQQQETFMRQHGQHMGGGYGGYGDTQGRGGPTGMQHQMQFQQEMLQQQLRQNNVAPGSPSKLSASAREFAPMPSSSLMMASAGNVSDGPPHSEDEQHQRVHAEFTTFHVFYKGDVCKSIQWLLQVQSSLKNSMAQEDTNAGSPHHDDNVILFKTLEHALDESTNELTTLIQEVSATRQWSKTIPLMAASTGRLLRQVTKAQAELTILEAGRAHLNKQVQLPSHQQQLSQEAVEQLLAKAKLTAMHHEVAQSWQKGLTQLAKQMDERQAAGAGERSEQHSSGGAHHGRLSHQNQVIEVIDSLVANLMAAAGPQASEPEGSAQGGQAGVGSEGGEGVAWAPGVAIGDASRARELGFAPVDDLLLRDDEADGDAHEGDDDEEEDGWQPPSLASALTRRFANGLRAEAASNV
eukprot:gene21906-28948_t